MIESCMVLGMLGIGTLEDIKEKKIHLWLIYLFCVIGIICHVIFRNITLIEMIFGMLPGAFLCFVSFLSRGKVGIGDGLMLTATGIFLGFWDNLALFTAALFLVGISGVICFACRKKEAQIPFLPFLLVSYVGLLAI